MSEINNSLSVRVDSQGGDAYLCILEELKQVDFKIASFLKALFSIVKSPKKAGESVDPWTR